MAASLRKTKKGILRRHCQQYHDLTGNAGGKFYCFHFQSERAYYLTPPRLMIVLIYSIHQIWFLMCCNKLSLYEITADVFRMVEIVSKNKIADICSTLAVQWDYFHSLSRIVWNCRLFQKALLNSMSRGNGQYMHLMSLALCVKRLHWRYSFSLLLNVSVGSAGAEIRFDKWVRGRIFDEGKRPEKCQLRLLSLSVWLFSETLF